MTNPMRRPLRPSEGRSIVHDVVPSLGIVSSMIRRAHECERTRDIPDRMPIIPAACIALVMWLAIGAAGAWAQEEDPAPVKDAWAGVEEFHVTGSSSGADLAQSTATAVTAFDDLALDIRTGLDGRSYGDLG